MFNFVKELRVIGVISSALGKISLKFCGNDFLEKLTIKERNLLASDTLQIIENLHSTKILDPDNLAPYFDDVVVCGFLLLAKKITPKDALNHQLVLLGLMNYINATFNQNGTISPTLLTEASNYLNSYKMG